MFESTQIRGGGFYALLRRLGLADDTGLRLKRSVPILVGLCWLPLAGLTALDGTLWGSSVDIPFLEDFSTYGRFLLALPLLLIGEKQVTAWLETLFAHLKASSLVPPSERSAADAAHDRALRMQDSGIAQLILLVLAFAIPLIALNWWHDTQSAVGVSSWLWGSAADQDLSAAGWWYMLFALPVVQFIVLRWIWRYVWWFLFLRSFSKLELELEATHPDAVGGLGSIQLTQGVFTSLFVAGAIMFSAIMANDIVYSGTAITSLYPEIAAYVIASLLVLLAPLAVFVSKLRRTKMAGVLEYGALGGSLSESFADRWRSKDPATLIDAADPSAVADYGATYGAVVAMRPFPFDLKQAMRIALVLVIPFTPLLLTTMSLKDLLQRLLGLIT